MRSNDHLELVRVKTREQRLDEYDVRRIVFIIEQGVDPSIEFDEHEADSAHFLLLKDKRPVGSSRYRWVGRSIKVERLAVLKEERGKGYGSFILERMLEEMLTLKPNNIFIHSQTAVAGFYQRFGFRRSGDEFEEANIEHIKMLYEGKEK